MILYLLIGIAVTATAQRQYRLWFDGQAEHVQTGKLAQTTRFVLDVSELPTGMHQLFMIITDETGIPLDQQSAVFFKVANGGIVRYEYYVNNWETLVGSKTYSRPQLPFLLETDLDVSGIEAKPFDSQNFYFCLDDGVPTMMAKNDIFFRFYSEDYTFVEAEAQYADANSAEAVVAEQLESEKTLWSTVPVKNAVNWYKAEIAEGDEVLFKVNVPSTMQLFAPDGTELPVTTGGKIEMKAADGGTYYLAVHDVTGSQTQMSVYFEVLGTEGIANVNADRPADGRVYNINGQQVVPVRKNIYIVNGRKLILK